MKRKQKQKQKPSRMSRRSSLARRRRRRRRRRTSSSESESASESSSVSSFSFSSVSSHRSDPIAGDCEEPPSKQHDNDSNTLQTPDFTQRQQNFRRDPTTAASNAGSSGSSSTANFRGGDSNSNDNNDDHSRDRQPAPAPLFHPNEKGTKKQKRCDHDSDGGSYNGCFGFEDRRNRNCNCNCNCNDAPSSVNKLKKIAGTMVDFDRQNIQTTWLGERLLFETLDDSEIDALVGLASHCGVDLGNERERESERERDHPNDNRGSGSGGDQRKATAAAAAASTSASTSASTGRSRCHDPKQKRFNPLVSLSASHDAPLPPSHIGYIRSRAKALLPLQQQQQQQQQTLTENGRRGRGNATTVTTNQPSRGTSQTTTTTTTTTKPKSSTLLDDSAAIATGMYLEEALTASLLPLAGLHVLRCRALEAMESTESEFGGTTIAPLVHNTQNNHNNNNNTANDDPPALRLQLRPTALHPITGEPVQMDMTNRIRWKEERAFGEWTLPPEEALLKLVEQGMLSKETPYHFVPNASRSWTPPQSQTLPQSQSQSQSQSQPQTSVVGDIGSTTTTNRNNGDGDGDDRIAMLAKRFDSDPSVVRANPEIFGIFVAKEDRPAVSGVEYDGHPSQSLR